MMTLVSLNDYFWKDLHMPKRSGYIDIGEQSLHYIAAGTGNKLLLAFHGYNNDAGIFLPFVPYIGSDYTIVSIDLPHHGKSDWPEHKQFEISQLVKLVDDIRGEFEVDKVSLIGYSIGGRVCLKVAELMPEHIDKILLAAPDGLAFNPLYYFVTRTRMGSRLFKAFLTNPERYMYMMDWMRRCRLVDESRYKFAMQYLRTESARSFLMRVWPGMSKLIPDAVKLKKAIKSYNIPVYIFMGSYDRIIPISLAQRFKKDMDTVELHILEKGHRVFDADTLPDMAKCLLS